MKTRAIIYTRVSSDRQVKEGNGLDSQELRCRRFAEDNGYQVIGVFKEEGESGGLFERTAMRRVLQCLEDNDSGNENDKIVVIFDDLKRFARDTEVHFGLKKEIYGRNGRVECPNFRFEDSPEGKFVETVMAATAELERNQNKRQVIQKMKARLERGFWTFMPPVGLKNFQDPIVGRVLGSDEPIASILKEAIEGFAQGVFVTPYEVKEFILAEYKKHGINRKLSVSGTMQILRNELYCGYIQYLPWGIEFKKGKHKGFITLETYLTVKDRLAKRSKGLVRKDYSLDFPLRGYTICSSCGKRLRASFNKGRGGYYGHYWCQTTGCLYRYKNTRKEKMEIMFEDLLMTIKPSEELIDITKQILIERWWKRLEQQKEKESSLRIELREIEYKKENFLNRIGKTIDESLISEYEGEVRKLSVREKEINSQLGSRIDKEVFGTAVENVFGILKKPQEMWRSEDYRDKTSILLMYFGENLKYDFVEGFGTASLAYPINKIGDFMSPISSDVEMSGCDPESKKTFLNLYKLSLLFF